MKQAKNKTEKEVEIVSKKPTHQVYKLTPLVAVISVIFIYFASQVLAINVFAAVAALFGNTTDQINALLRDSLLVKSVILGVIVVFVVGLVAILLRITRTSWKEIGFTKPKLGHIGSALIGYGWYFLLNFVVMLFVGAFLTQVDLDQQQQLGFDRLATGSALWLTGFSLVILPALYEELLMRGVLFTGLRSKLSFWWTLFGVSLLFGAAHLEWLGDGPLNWAAAIDTFMLSAVLVYLREQSKSIWPAIILHAFKNFVAFMLVFVFKVAGN